MARKVAKKVVKKAAKVAAKKVVRSPRKKKEQTLQEKMGFRWDRVKQQWVKTTVNENDLNMLITRLNARVTIIERKIEEAEKAGAKIQQDLQQWREHSAPKWKARQPADGKPNIRHAKVLVMTRGGWKSEAPQSVDAYDWKENGDKTIIAYAVF